MKLAARIGGGRSASGRRGSPGRAQLPCEERWRAVAGVEQRWAHGTHKAGFYASVELFRAVGRGLEWPPGAVGWIWLARKVESARGGAGVGGGGID